MRYARAGWLAAVMWLLSVAVGCGSEVETSHSAADVSAAVDASGETVSSMDAPVSTDAEPNEPSDVLDLFVDEASQEDTAPPQDVDPGLFAYLVVEPAALNFGAQNIGTVHTQSLELENAGQVSLAISSVSLVDGSEMFGTNVSQVFLGPGQKKLIYVSFFVLDFGVFEDVLRFQSNAVNGAVVDVPLVGVGSEPVCADLDGDGHGAGCFAGADCNESDPDVYVGAPEKCNGQDEDCDGLHDEDFVGLGAACEVGFGACINTGFKICGDDEATLKCSVNPVTGGSELCNEQDDDCDGAIDEEFPSKGKLCSVGQGACKAVDKFVCTEDGTALVCNVTPIEPVLEACDDGIDNDCDGIVDEGELEVCGDGVDNDCDGETDESGSAWGEVFWARNWYSQSIEITPSNGDGTFGDSVLVDFGDDNNYSVIAVGDFDGDQWLDLMVYQTDTDGMTKCSKPQDCPSGTFCAAGTCRTMCTSDAQCDQAAGEKCIDTNASADAQYTNCVPPPQVYLARSSCGGSEVELQFMFALEPGESLGPVIDADNNGHLDFVGRNLWSEATAFTLLNDGEGGFSKIDPSLDMAAMVTWSWGLARTSKDLNGDGIVDLLGRSFTSGGSPPTTLWFIEGMGDGLFAAPVNMAYTLPKPANLVTADDFDGDGDQDIVGGLDDDGQPGGVWMLLNREAEDGKSWVNAYEIFDVAPKYNSGGEHPGYGNGTSYDFDNDHYPDVLAVWVPEECGSYLWNCPAVTDPEHPCYGGACRKIAYIRNQTAQPCLPGTLCVDGQCEAGCEADCSGKQCGDDGCSGSCGQCGGGQICTGGGQCVVDCVPDCDGKVCGNNGCGGNCGECVQGLSCKLGQCEAGCVPSCAGKACGDDGCGGRCAVFAAPVILKYDDNPTMGVMAPTNAPPTEPVLAMQPAGATAADDLECVLAQPSYDLNPVTYHYRWLKDGAFQKNVGNVAIVSAELTQAGQVWACQVRATDGTEWSPTASVVVLVAEAPPEGNP